jgi:hypothetical protein
LEPRMRLQRQLIRYLGDFVECTRCGARKLRDSKKQMEDILKRVSELEKKSR